MVGNVIRCGGGVATITSYVSANKVIANLTTQITSFVQNDPNNTPIPQPSGSWSISTPTTIVGGLNHLNGLTVSIIGDGNVFPPQTVTNNQVILSRPCSQILVGLPFVCQLQTPYLDPQQAENVQGRRKTIYAATVRMEGSRGIQVGADQPDASTVANYANQTWSNLNQIKERGPLNLAGQPLPLITGDEYVLLQDSFTTNGQVAIQQSNPMPANILAIVRYYELGDPQG